jgi:hypothetical protein
MEENEAISAIDAIYEILDRIKLIERHIGVLDSNIKLLNNKIVRLKIDSDEKKEAAPEKPSEPKQRPVAKAAEPEFFVEQAKSQPAQKREPERLVIGNIKTFGRIVNKNKEPIPDVEVNVYSHSNELIRTIKTDGNGYWECKLPSGQFGVEYLRKNYKPVNIVITLDSTMSNYEVK